MTVTPSIGLILGGLASVLMMVAIIIGIFYLIHRLSRKNPR